MSAPLALVRYRPPPGGRVRGIGPSFRQDSSGAAGGDGSLLVRKHILHATYFSSRHLPQALSPARTIGTDAQTKLRPAMPYRPRARPGRGALDPARRP